MGPIPWGAINAYAIRYGITDIDEFEPFVAMIQAMDDAFCAFHARKRETEAEN